MFTENKVKIMDERRSKKGEKGYKAHIFFFALIFLTAAICVVAHFMDNETGGGTGKELAKGDLPQASVTQTTAAVTTATSASATQAVTEKGVPKSQAKPEEYLKSCAFVGALYSEQL